jgi:cytochrome P450
MHHDARWFPEPLAFRPERFGPGAPAFPRVCLGQHLAITEMTVIAAMLLQRFTLSAPAGMGAPRPVFNVSPRPHRPLALRLGSHR